MIFGLRGFGSSNTICAKGQTRTLWSWLTAVADAQRDGGRARGTKKVFSLHFFQAGPEKPYLMTAH